MTVLSWPTELPSGSYSADADVTVPGANIILDLHGDPANADLVIFLAGNQYRVLPDLIAEFWLWVAGSAGHNELVRGNVFYATLPPGRLIDAMELGMLRFGNFSLSLHPDGLWPDVFMTGQKQHARLQRANHIESYRIYARSRGSVILVRAGNPKRVQSVRDLLRDDVRVAISSPKREPASFESYAATISAQGGAEMVNRLLAKMTTVTPQYVHHREIPQFLADGVADAALMYFHFGDFLQRTFPDVFAYVSLPSEGNFIDEFAAARIRTARRQRHASAWCDFLTTSAASGVFVRHGFDWAGTTS